MSSAKTTTLKGGMRKAKGTRPATRQRTGQLSVPQQVLEGLREMSEFATSGEPPEKRYTVRHLTLDLEHAGQGPCDPRGLRSVATAVRQVPRGRGLGAPALGAGRPRALSSRPPVPGRDERHARPLVGKDRDGGSENPEGSPWKEVVTSQGW